MRRAITTMLFCLSLSPPLLAADYRFTVIDFPDSIYTVARGINARGDITGAYSDADNVGHAFLLRDGVYSTIDVPGARSTQGATSINARGDIVGNFFDWDGVQHAFLLSDGQYTQIDYPGANSTAAWGINNAGEIVGAWGDPVLGMGRAFILTSGEFHDVTVPVPDAPDTKLFGVQDSGRVWVGNVLTPDDGLYHGFIGTLSGAFHLIDFPDPSAACTAPRWINQRRDIVGYFCAEGEIHHGFLLRHGRYKQIDVPRSTSTDVFAINDDGVLVGGFTDRREIGHGFRAVPRH